MAPERRLFAMESPRAENVGRERHGFNDGQLEDGISDVHMASRRAEEAVLRRYQAGRWLQEMLGNLGMSDEPSEEEFRVVLRSGIVLCTLLNKIQPGLVPKVVESSVPSSPSDAAHSAYQSFENVRNFLVAIEEINLPSFEASDLAEETGSFTKVVDCILSLKSWRVCPWKYSGYRSPARASAILEDMYAMDETLATPKSGHTRKRWAIPEFYEVNDASLPGTPNSQLEKSPGGNANGYRSFDDTENLTASPAARLHQIGQRFREVLQVKRVPDLQTSDVDTGLKSQSLPSLVKSIICDKQPDEVPALVEYMMRKIMEEFERRLRCQGEQLKRLKSVHKDLVNRESKLMARAKCLEALAAGSSEEIKLVTQQLHQTKMEKKRLEDEKALHEANAERDKEENKKCIALLRNEVLLLKDNLKKQQEMKTEQERVIAGYSEKVMEIETKLEDSLTTIRSFEVKMASERRKFELREEKYKRIISVQSQAIEDLKHTSHAIRTDAFHMQQCWQEQLTTLESELTGLTNAAQAYHDVLSENRRLYNEVQDLKGNIRVYCRVRPFLIGQLEDGTSVEFIGDNGEIVITNPVKHGKDSCRMFNFNKVYGPQAGQEEVFFDAQPLIRSVLDGYNVCIFAYGQTGSGKTYTMTGPTTESKQDWGVNYRALNDLFQLCQKRKEVFAYEVMVQMIEIYNEQVRDLLAADGVSKRLGIRTSSSLNGVHVPDAVMIPVNSSADVLEIMAVGQRNRAVGATALNERSSRSHSVLTVHVQGTDLVKGGVLRGCLHLVDLAGSERVEKSEATGDRLKEAQHINKSLSALGDVIAALAQKSSHIPYRNSKLTQLLQHSLGGQSKAMMFVHINPDTDSYNETISTLKFAERVSSVELGAARSNREAGEFREYKEQIAALKEMVARKDAEIERLQGAKLVRSGTEIDSRKLKTNRLSFDGRGLRKSVDVRPVEALASTSRTSSREPSPDESEFRRQAKSQTEAPRESGAPLSKDTQESFVVHTNIDAARNLEEELSEGYASQDSASVASDHSSQYIRATQGSRQHSESDLRSLLQSQIPRPRRSEKKHALPVGVSASAAGVRRLSDVAGLEDTTKRGSKLSSSSGVFSPSRSQLPKSSKRWV